MLVNGKPGNTISIRDRGLLYGDGVFRTLRVSQGRGLQWARHFRQLKHDCGVLGIACPDEAVLFAELDAIVEQSADCVLKLVVTRGENARGYAPAADAEPVHFWDAFPLPNYPADWARHGVKVHLCQLRLGWQPRLAGIKHLNRLENVLAAAEFAGTDMAEGVLLDIAGNVVEGTRSNLFVLKNGELLTPDLGRCGVAGVQRGRVMELAAAHGLSCRVEQFVLADLLAADEVFLVNSIMGLWPVCEMSGRNWTRHPVGLQIQEWLNHATD